MYVCLTFDRTSVEPSGECLIMPAPSLFADPSSPRAMYGLSVQTLSTKLLVGGHRQTWSLHRRTLPDPSRHV